jgi:hypothetical protein
MDIIARTKWLMMCKEILAISSENHMKPIETLYEQDAKIVNIKACGRLHLDTTLQPEVFGNIL